MLGALRFHLQHFMNEGGMVIFQVFNGPVQIFNKKRNLANSRAENFQILCGVAVVGERGGNHYLDPVG